MSRLSGSSYIWVAIFVVIFACSMDFWKWDEPLVLIIFGLPSWIIYFLILQIVLVFAIAIFSRYYWNSNRR